MKIYLSAKADKQLRKIPLKMYQFIIGHIEMLEYNPIPAKAKKLIQREGWRIRVGDYRILYTFDEKKKEVIILSVAHRKDVYKYS